MALDLAKIQTEEDRMAIQRMVRSSRRKYKSGNYGPAKDKILGYVNPAELEASTIIPDEIMAHWKANHVLPFGYASLEKGLDFNQIYRLWKGAVVRMSVSRFGHPNAYKILGQGIK